jgi:hypothetical protein
MEALTKDIRYALRGLLKRPGFTLSLMINVADLAGATNGEANARGVRKIQIDLPRDGFSRRVLFDRRHELGWNDRADRSFDRDGDVRQDTEEPDGGIE